MRKRRILSLLLAVAVTVTMLIAVPLTASAATSTYDFTGLQSELPATKPSDSTTKTISAGDITIELLSSTWYFNDGLTSNTDPSGQEKNAAEGATTTKVPASGNVVKLKFKNNGKVKMNVKINTGKDTFVCEFPADAVTEADGKVIKKYAANTQNSTDITIGFDVQTEKDYYVYTSGSKLTYKDITFTPEGEEESPYSITASADKAYVGAPVTLTANGLEGTVTWSVDTQKGTVTADSKDDKKATFKGKSTGFITVTASTGSASATCDIEVSLAPAPNTTEKQGGVENLVAAQKTTTYDLLETFSTQLDPDTAATEAAAYKGGYLYFNDQIASTATSNLYYSNKTSYKIDGTKDNHGGIRVKKKQDVFALKLASGSIVKVDIAGGGGGERYGVITKVSDYTDEGSDATKKEYLVKSEDIGTNNQNLANHHQLLTYENKNETDEIIYITATGDSFISQIQVIVPDSDAYFGEGATDTGCYTEGELTEGVIRFLQPYVGDQNVTSYGMYFINSKGDVEKATIKGTVQLTSNSGIMADLYGIEKDNKNIYSAMAYVVIDDQTIWSKPINGSIDWDSEVKEIKKDDSYIK